MPNTRSYVKSLPLYLLVIYIFAFLLISPEVATLECKNALTLCFLRVIPTLFPFMVISDFMISSGFAELLGKGAGKLFSKAFLCSEISSVAFLCGTLFGYPLGAKSAIDLYKKGCVSKEEAERLICFCSNTGPMFVISIVGVALNSKSAAVAIYVSQILSAVIIGIFLRKNGRSEKKSARNETVEYQSESQFLYLPKAITNSVIPMLNVCAFVCFFSVIKGSVDNILAFFNAGQYLSVFIAGLLEITNGISSAAYVNTALSKIFLAAFFVGWSGLSVCLQTVSLSAGAELHTGKFMLSKLFQGILCAIFSTIICKYLNLY